jgi:hypothetical protein
LGQACGLSAGGFASGRRQRCDAKNVDLPVTPKVWMNAARRRRRRRRRRQAPGRPAPARPPLRGPRLGLNPIVTSQYSSTTSDQVSYHIQSLFSESGDRVYPHPHPRPRRRRRTPPAPTSETPAAAPSPPPRAPGVRSYCRFRKRGTEYVSDSGMKWMSKS